MQIHELYAGSSPLSRGIRPGCRSRCRSSRIIPALTGNTTCRHCWTSPSQGSSPLSRGIPRHPSHDFSDTGIIPALAGNTLRRVQHRILGGDHPRSRGEYKIMKDRSVYNEGSSPLSRGIPTPQSGLHGIARIIPALAGNTSARRSACARTRDHPRSRGEYASIPQ